MRARCLLLVTVVVLVLSAVGPVMAEEPTPLPDDSLAPLADPLSETAFVDLPVAGWGDNRYRQADPPAGFTDVVAIAAGGYHSLANPSAAPADRIENLVATVEGLNLENGISNSLEAELANVVKARDDVNENSNVAAINNLEAFINEVDAQSGNKISEEEAAYLIALAQEIIDLLTE